VSAGVKWARASRAWGMCSRSGKRTLLRDMVADGYIKGLRVAPDEWDPPHPQERFEPLVDAQFVRNPAPDLDRSKDFARAYPYAGVFAPCSVGVATATGS
jgi:hypothetical protein